MLKNDVFVVGIGGSSGGLEAIFTLFSHMPDKPGVAFIIVRHLSRDYKTNSKFLLAQYTAIPIKMIESGMEIEANCIYVMPENTKLTLKDRKLYLAERPTSELINTAVDDFFISFAEDIKEKAIGIILSGAGTDGTKGASAIKQHGGLVIVQSPEQAQFEGMPSNVIYFDHPDYVLHLEDIPKRILLYIKTPREVKPIA